MLGGPRRLPRSVGFASVLRDASARHSARIEFERAIARLGIRLKELQPTNHKPSPTNAGSLRGASNTALSKWPQTKLLSKRAQLQRNDGHPNAAMRYSFLGLRPRQRSDAAIVNDCVDCVCGTNSATFERSADDGRWRLTREIERRDLNCARATAAAARGVLERVARGADAIQLARSFAAAVARAARLNEAEPSDAAAAHAVAKAAADYVEDAERIVVKWRDADRATLIAIDRAWAPLFRRGLVLEHIITEARGGGVRSTWARSS